ncbi:hypothetical protein JW848_00880 [Candidatus Bipolaricaulota bacterium]|nr:hypothetical protein [Candidatus Bipolaricaulota bacterium]
MRFDELVPDIKVKHPATAAVFERYAFVYSCDDCPVEQAWHNYGTDSRDMVAEQNQAIARGER